MLHKSVSYKALFRVAGLLFIAFGLYHALSVAFSLAGAGENVSGILIAILGLYGGEFPYGGAFIYIGLGLFLLGLGSVRAKLAYWSLQVAVWLIGISLWYEQTGVTDVRLVPVFATPLSFWPQMVITLICSLLLFALYIPLTRLLARLLEAGNEHNHENMKELVTPNK
jgi:hypothetical protein